MPRKICVDSGYIVELDDGVLIGIAAYEGAEEGILEYLEKYNRRCHRIEYVRGWKEADKLLVKYGIMTQAEYDWEK